MCIYCEGAHEEAAEEPSVAEILIDESNRTEAATIGAVQRLKQWVANR